MVCRTLRRCVPGATTDEVFHSTHAQVSVCKGGPVWGDKTWCVSVTSVTSHPVSTVCSSQNADAEIFNTAVSLTPVFTLGFPRMLLHLNTTLLLANETCSLCWPISDNIAFLFGSRLLLLSSLLCSKIKQNKTSLKESPLQSLLFFLLLFPFCKSLPHLPHAPPFPFSADASGSKIRQQLWLMCGYKHGRLGSLSLVSFCVPSVPVCQYLSHPAQTSGAFGGTAS